jgi:hypothetical protein
MTSTSTTAVRLGGVDRAPSLRNVLLASLVVAVLGAAAYSIDVLVTRSGPSIGAGRPATWLPSQQLHEATEHTVVGTYAAPAITVAGGDVRVKAPGFSAVAVVTGPLVPGEGFQYQPRFVSATWTVHIFDVKGTIPLAASDFDSIDYAGAAFHMQPPQGTTVPKSVSTGRQVTFQLRANVLIGEDLFRWAPNGNDIIAKWDNQVEND